VKASRLSFILLAGFILASFGLFRIQILKGAYYRVLSEKNRIRVIYLEASRGNILDRNNKPLISNRLSFNCSVITREARQSIKRSCKILAPILGVSAEELEKRFRKSKPGVFNTVLMAEDINASKAIEIEERLEDLPGFIIETRPLREYPNEKSAAHLTGYIGPITQQEADFLDAYGYREADWLGRDGLEKMYESYLRGQSGGLQMEVDSRGRFLRALGLKEPREGKDIQLTIDSRLQVFVQDLLISQKGAVILMNLGDGGILSMNSSPSFDPNLFASTEGRKGVGKYLRGAGAPMVNRGIRGQYPAGSIFKIITALAGLESKKVSALSTFNCPGYTAVGGKIFHCWRETGHGPQRMSEAFAHSCNVYFYNVGLMTGINFLTQKTLEFGFSKLTGVDLPGEKGGFVPSREWKQRSQQQGWYDGETVNLAIGQGYLQVTPVQALVMIAAIATDGHLFKPHLIDKIEGVRVAEKHARYLNIDAAHLKAVKEGLDAVVNSDTGTGRLARAAGVHIAGKTGTAQSGQDKTHAWFVGFAPEENPKVALVVFVENGGRGGVVAAKLAGAIFQKLKETSYL